MKTFRLILALCTVLLFATLAGIDRHIVIPAKQIAYDLAPRVVTLLTPLHDALFRFMSMTGLIRGANNLLTISMITNETLMVITNELTFASEVNRQYDDRFAITGAKIGATVNARRPARFIGTTGPNLNVEDFNATYLPVSLTTQFHVDTQFTTQDLALSMDMFSENLIQPAVAAIANKIDRDGLVQMKNQTANIVGQAGVPPTGTATYLTGAAYLDAEGTPRDGKRATVIEPFTNAAIIDSIKGLFVPMDKIGKQFTKGMMGRDSLGSNWKMDQNVVSHTFGSWATTVGTLTVNTTTNAGFLTTGWANTSTITLTSNQQLTLNQGDVIQIGNLFAANPQNRQAYGTNRLRNFVVTATVTFNGAQAVTVSPAIITAGQFQNVQVLGTTSTTATVTPFNIAATTAGAVVSPQNVLFHKNSITLCSADLEMPEGVHFAGRASSKDIGLSVRVVRQYTINNDSIPTRIDVLYGWAQLYNEFGCRMAA